VPITCPPVIFSISAMENMGELYHFSSVSRVLIFTAGPASFIQFTTFYMGWRPICRLLTSDKNLQFFTAFDEE
jgi:hypothetical protein